MDTYAKLMSCACWAAVVCWLAGEAAVTGERLELTMAREEVCVVTMGERLDRLELLVGPYLEVYHDVLMPRIADE